MTEDRKPKAPESTAPSPAPPTAARPASPPSLAGKPSRTISAERVGELHASHKRERGRRASADSMLAAPDHAIKIQSLKADVPAIALEGERAAEVLRLVGEQAEAEINAANDELASHGISVGGAA